MSVLTGLDWKGLLVSRKIGCGILINDFLPLLTNNSCGDWEIWEIEHVWLFYFTTEDAKLLVCVALVKIRAVEIHVLILGCFLGFVCNAINVQ